MNASFFLKKLKKTLIKNLYLLYIYIYLTPILKLRKVCKKNIYANN